MVLMPMRDEDGLNLVLPTRNKLRVWEDPVDAKLVETAFIGTPVISE